jgi:hypothetical protein
MPSQGVRTALTFFLLFHLYCLFVAVVGNPPTSALLRKLHSIGVWAYLAPLGMDMSYRFDFTQGTEMDRGWVLEADLKDSAGTRTVQVADELKQSRLPIQRQRFYWLLRELGYQDDQRQSHIAKALGARLLQEYGVNELTLRLRARGLLDQDQVRRDRDPHDPALLTTIYQARVSKTSSGRIFFLKLTAGSQTAPTAQPDPQTPAPRPDLKSPLPPR